MSPCRPELREPKRHELPDSPAGFPSSLPPQEARESMSWLLELSKTRISKARAAVGKHKTNPRPATDATTNNKQRLAICFQSQC